MDQVLSCRPLVAGHAKGRMLCTQQSISFWGGVDPASGEILDPRHECFGQSITGAVLAFPYGKGSAAAPLVLLELVRRHTTPAAIINVEIDPLLVAGAIISKHYYKIVFPVVTLLRVSFDELQSGDHAIVDGEKGEVIISHK